MVTKKIYRAWVVSASIGACIALATSIAAYATKSFFGFVIGVIVSYLLYCIIFHGLCLQLVPNINALIVKEDIKTESTTTTITTHFRHKGDEELDKYIDRYIDARLASKHVLAGLAVMVIIVIIAIITHNLQPIPKKLKKCE